jgi:chemotaxis regulatin CheY-phosphate phosphatase CheZ
MRKIITKKSSKGSLKVGANKRGASRRSALKATSKKRGTKIVTPDDVVPQLSGALEELLVAFAHGDEQSVKSSLNQLCKASEVKRLHSKANELLKSFHASIWSLRSDFDTKKLSMTSTSLPEASKSLDKVLVRAGEAAHRVLALVEQQEVIQSQSEQLLLGLEKQLASGTIDRKALERGLTECRALVSQTRKIASEMVYTQDFEDLCGQVIYKVRQLIVKLEEEIRNLLVNLKVDVPAASAEGNEGPQQGLADQSSVDDLLKNFGL